LRLRSILESDNRGAASAPPPSIPIAPCTPLAVCSTADPNDPTGVGRVETIGCLRGVQEVHCGNGLVRAGVPRESHSVAHAR